MPDWVAAEYDVKWETLRILSHCMHMPCRDVAVWVLAAHFRQQALRISLVFLRRRISSGEKSINFLVRNFFPVSHLAQAIRTSSSHVEQNPEGEAGRLLQNASPR